MVNYLKMKGIEFIEFSSFGPSEMSELFFQLGFSRSGSHKTKFIDHYNQNDINLLLNYQTGTFAHRFQQIHGPSVCSMAFRVENANYAFNMAVKRGAKEAPSDYSPLKAIYGIGESLIYFVDVDSEKLYPLLGLDDKKNEKMFPTKGFQSIDHLTNNVEKGQLQKWGQFYKDIFGFEEIRYFNIRGQKTGLTSYALQSPCKSFCIPINEGTDKKSQINEYLEEYKGAGIQHIALLTYDIISSLRMLKDTTIKTLSIDDEYYVDILKKVPRVTESLEDLKKYQILVDGDQKGYLLQLFTKNVVGPIFFEILQRKNHDSFGEGNFSALFRSIEKDQEQRGYL